MTRYGIPPSLVGAALALLLLASAARAQGVPVRTAEHDGFTRIVVDFPRRPDWRLGRAGDRYELRAPGTGAYDLSDIYRRIYADRLQRLEDLGDGRLGITLGCVCNLSVIELPNQGLVIDVRDGAPAPDDPYNIVLDPGEITPALSRDMASLRLPVVLPPPAASLDLAALGGPPRDSAEGPDQAAVERVTALREELIAQIAHGMTQGMVKMDTGRLDQLLRSTQPAAEAEATPPPPEPAPLPGAHMRIETQVDRDRRARTGSLDGTPPHLCLDDELFDVGSWYEPEQLSRSVGAAYAALFDARDRPDAAAYRNLARDMLYRTFGAEARSAIREGPADIPDRDILEDMGRIMDGDTVPERSVIARQIDCNSPGALWGLLAQDAVTPDTRMNTEAILRTLSAWPPHLRRHLGPRIARKFLDAGDRDAALAARNAVERGGSGPTPEAAMLEAQLRLDVGDHRSAEPILAEIAASRTVEAAGALADLIASRIESNGSVGDDLLDSARALAFELEADPAGQALTARIVEALVHEQRYAEALADLRDGQSREALPPETAEQLRDRTFAALAKRSDDATFLELALPALGEAPLGSAARLAVADRLVALRLPEQARKALGVNLAIPKPRERILLARIALMEDRPRIAESYLAGLEDQEAQALLKKAAARPDAVPDLPSPPAETTVAIPEAPTGLLARNRDLLGASRERRRALQNLLQTGG
ncbi:hypothetical protein [Oceaniglobus roseus]|uniref:hypothetical protein n=1 Tax=Oceaniglobus roseus TaxID=1737570 RepID=UPI000C7ECBE9|nr:hypothetical protein [Kandeliimicrobium roseum]